MESWRNICFVCIVNLVMFKIKPIVDEYGIELKYPYRECKKCRNYPCFPEIDKCSSNFAAYGCFLYKNKKGSRNAAITKKLYETALENVE